LLLVAALLDGKPAVFIVRGGSEGLSFREEQGMGLKAAQTVTMHLDNVIGEKLGEDDFDYTTFLDLSAFAWCALALGHLTVRAGLRHSLLQ
jgi:alkylation response protein AidB-like acyl-CoA dehydrogenase